MAGKQYDNSGVLFKNTRREKDTHPQYNGSITVDGKDYWISGWVKKGNKGSFISLALKPKEQKANKESSSAENDDLGFDDDIPF